MPVPSLSERVSALTLTSCKDGRLEKNAKGERLDEDQGFCAQDKTTSQHHNERRDPEIWSAHQERERGGVREGTSLILVFKTKRNYHKPG